MDDNAPSPKDVSEGATYELTLKGQGVEVDRKVDEEVALQILATVMGGGQVTGARPPVRQRPVQSRADGRGQALREYLDEVQPKRNVDKILAVASYLKVERGAETFGADDIKKQFRSASEPVPGNYSRDFRWAVAAGWVAPVSDEPGEFYVTKKGDEAVEARFSAEVKRSTTVGKTVRRRRGRKKEDKE
jgi:hypothetical protein